MMLTSNMIHLVFLAFDMSVHIDKTTVFMQAVTYTSNICFIIEIAPTLSKWNKNHNLMS